MIFSCAKTRRDLLVAVVFVWPTWPSSPSRQRPLFPRQEIPLTCCNKMKKISAGKFRQRIKWSINRSNHRLTTLSIVSKQYHLMPKFSSGFIRFSTTEQILETGFFILQKIVANVLWLPVGQRDSSFAAGTVQKCPRPAVPPVFSAKTN